MKRIRFSDTAVSKAKQSIQDSELPALTLQVSSTGRKTFYCTKRMPSGQLFKKKIGCYPEISTKQAKAICQEWLALIAQGKNPTTANKQQSLENLKFFDAWHIFEQRHIAHQKPKTRICYATVFKHLQAFGFSDMPITAVQKRDFSRILHELQDKKRTANMILTYCRTFYNKLIEWEILPPEFKNPTIGIKKYAEKSRDRFLSYDELKRFFEALAEESLQWQAFFKLALLTGIRRSNLQSLKWHQINFEEKTLTINCDESKTGVGQLLPLSQEAVALLLSLAELRKEKSDYVFPSAKAAEGHINSPTKALQRICQRAGINDLRFHDLRRTFASWQALQGSSLLIIGRSLNHSSIQSTQVYARLSIEPVRESIEKASSALLNLWLKAVRER